jgi:hypothetical protein
MNEGALATILVARSVGEVHQTMAGDGSQQRKPDLRTAIEDFKAITTMVRGARSPAVLAAIGVVATLLLALMVVVVLLLTGGSRRLSNNAALIGALIALGGVFTAQVVGIALDDQRSQEARELEAQRAHEAALQNYFEQVGEILIKQPLHRASPSDNLSTVVRAQTMSVLEGLDPERKRILLMFLHESGLIHSRRPVVSLVAATLSEANLDKVNLSGSYLRGAILRDAILSGAALPEADLLGANLIGANLRDAVLLGAKLLGANLKDADLSGAKGITNEELEQQVYSLEGATMPDSQTYEDWKSKGRGKVREDSSP